MIDTDPVIEHLRQLAAEPVGNINLDEVVRRGRSRRRIRHVLRAVMATGTAGAVAVAAFALSGAQSGTGTHAVVAASPAPLPSLLPSPSASVPIGQGTLPYGAPTGIDTYRGNPDVANDPTQFAPDGHRWTKGDVIPFHVELLTCAMCNGQTELHFVLANGGQIQSGLGFVPGHAPHPGAQPGNADEAAAVFYSDGTALIAGTYGDIAYGIVPAGVTHVIAKGNLGEVYTNTIAIPGVDIRAFVVPSDGVGI